jgi:hypothetical protein
MPRNIKTANANMVSDYQSDMLFHGLVKKLGRNVHTTHDLWWHHKDKKEKNPQLFNEIWGSGFTIYGLLDKEEYEHKGAEVLTNIEVTCEMENLITNINVMSAGSRYDAVVIPIHHTMTKQDDYLLEVINFLQDVGFEKKQIIVVDGWDKEHLNRNIASLCTYYKREMKDHHEEYARPISFAFPKEKIRKLNDSKRTLAFAPLIPVNQSIDPSYMSTYAYETEESYYDMYQTAHFSYTSKKGGWDTLRHYEIIANGSIPFFVDIEKCPKHTLWNLPKERLIQAKYILGGMPNLTIGQWENKPLPHCGVINKEAPGCFVNFKSDLWEHFRQSLYDWLGREGTTEALADYVLGNI